MDPFENQLSSFGGGGHDPFASHAQHMQHVQQMQQQQGGGHDPFASHARHMQQVQQMHQQQGGNHARHMQQVQQMQQQMMGGMMGGMGGMNMAQQMQQMQQQMMGGMNDGFGGHMLGGTSRCGWFPLVSTCCKKKGSHLNLTRVCSLFCCLCVVFFWPQGVVATTVARSPPFLRRPVLPRVPMEKLKIFNHNTRRPTWAGVEFRNPNKRTPTVMVLIK